MQLIGLVVKLFPEKYRMIYIKSDLLPYRSHGGVSSLETPENRQSVKMKEEVLSSLYKVHPQAKSQIAKALRSPNDSGTFCHKPDSVSP